MPHQNPINIGIIGAGTIGSFLIRELKNDPAFKLVAVADVDTAICMKVLTDNGYPKSLHLPLEKFPENTDVFIEAASGKVAPIVAKFALERGKTAIIASIGGLDDIDIYRKIATKTGGRLILPSGAISGLDALKAIPSASITEVALKTTKPASTLSDAKYFTEKGINPRDLTAPVCVFSGVAREAAKEFPKSINVAAALSHATIGLDRTKVEIWADPSGDRNIHEIRVVSGHGTLETRTSNVPFEENPKTSRLAAYSILATIRNLTGTVIVGT
ncbi:MAG: DUF108 domain-containing protein [bacterium]|nr:DUF108 domain-containing protein [bacterium]